MALRPGAAKEKAVQLELESLKTTREKLKAQLRELEAEQRKLEADLKALRQKEIRAKREIEALSTLIELREPKPDGDASAEPAR